MDKPRSCSSCGRKCYKVSYYVEDTESKFPLCSFCLDKKRMIWKAHIEDLERGFKHHYCRNCGEKMNPKIFSSNGGYCDFCIQLKVRDDGIRNKLHNEALEHERQKTVR